MDVLAQQEANAVLAGYTAIVAAIERMNATNVNTAQAGATREALTNAQQGIFNAVNVAHARAKCPHAIVLIDQLLGVPA